MSQPYRIGWLNGKCVLLVWRDAAGKRKRYSLGTGDPREATRRAPAVYAELTRPLGRSVAELWNAYVADRQGRAILIIAMPAHHSLGPDDAQGIKNTRVATIEPDEQGAVDPTQMQSSARRALLR
jgi:hypothetical protein